MKKLLALTTAVLLLIAATAFAADYNYVSPDKFKEWMTTGKKTIIVDIQVPSEFAKRHIKVPSKPTPIRSSRTRNRNTWTPF